MKKIIMTLMLVVTCGLMVGCGDDDWSNNNPAMEHIYYYGLGNVKYPGGNELQYTVKQGETLSVPTYFFSAYKRKYSPVVSYYVQSDALVRGTDYEVVDKSGNALSADANGGYSMTWPNALQGSQDVYIKALNGATGKLRVMTYNPADESKLSQNDVSTTTIAKTAEYEVRAFTENYYVTVNVK